MVSPVSMGFDWNTIRVNKQRRIDKSNTRENSSKVPHTYNRDKGDFNTLKKPGILQKLTITQEGLY